LRYIDEDGVPVVVYVTNERQGGLLWAIRQASEDVGTARHAIVRLFLRDFKAQFRQKILGYFWALLTPLFGILSFLFLYFAGLLKPGVEEVPYPIYVLLGTSIWGCFVGTMGSVSNGLQAQADLIMRTNIPKLALAISSLANVIYSILISMITTGLVFLIYGFKPSAWFAAYPLLVLPMLVLGTAMGLVLSVVGSIARDLTQMIQQGLALLMYATPVIYVAAQVDIPLIRHAIVLNPLTYLIEVPRSLICSGQADNIVLYLWISLGTLTVGLVALRIFYLIHDLVAERL